MLLLFLTLCFIAQQPAHCSECDCAVESLLLLKGRWFVVEYKSILSPQQKVRIQNWSVFFLLRTDGFGSSAKLKNPNVSHGSYLLKLPEGKI